MVSRPFARTGPLFGWGHYPVETCDEYRPDGLGDLRTTVRDAGPRTLIARGNGRAYGDAALNLEGGVVSTERLDRMLGFDEAEGILHCESAVTLPEIIDRFLPRGWFFPVTPGTKHISVGGAVAADVHGKNHHRDGSIGRHLRALTLMLASGEVVTCSPERDAELFHATVGGMGLTGIVLDAKIALKRVETAWVHGHTKRARNLEETLREITEHDRDHAYAVSWIDCVSRGRNLGRSVMLRADEAPLADLPAAHRAAPLEISPPTSLLVPWRPPFGLVNRLSTRVFNAVYYGAHRDGTALGNYERYFYPLDGIAAWNRVYGRRGVLQYQIVVPVETAHETMTRVIERIAADRRASFLGVIKSMGEQGDGLLSFPRPGLTLSVDFPYTGPDLIALLHGLDDLVAAAGGRVYLAKDACLRADHVDAMYPGAARFREIKTKVDPEGRFSSSLSRRLGLTEAA